MRLLVMTLVLLAIAASLALAQPQVRIDPGAIVPVGGTWFEMGSHEDDVRYALELCVLSNAGVAEPGGGECLHQLFEEEMPAHRVWISAFAMDRTEVTHDAYGRCVAAAHCPPPRGSAGDPRIALGSQPVTRVSWGEAARYCAFAGGRLPTEAEWELGARGTTDRRFPWGRLYNSRLANHGRGTDVVDGDDGFRHAAPVGSFPDGASPYGLLDMAGNVWEWTADVYAVDQYRTASRVDPRGDGEGGLRIVRGGSWNFPPYTLRVTNRARLAETEAWPDVGFRCAYDPPGTRQIPPLSSAP